MSRKQPLRSAIKLKTGIRNYHSILKNGTLYRSELQNYVDETVYTTGLNMYFSYQWGEANASFKESAWSDSGWAMTYWGLALSMGPAIIFRTCMS